MKFAIIASPNFAKSFNKLLDGDILKISPKTALRLKKIHTKIIDEFKLINETRKRYAVELAEKDADGKPIIEKDNYKMLPQNKVILEDKLNQLMDQDFDFGPKFAFIEIEKLDLSVKDLINLDGLIDEPIE